MRPFNSYTRGVLMAAAADPAAAAGLPQVGRPADPAPDPAVQRMQQELQRQRTEVDRLRGLVFTNQQQQQQQPPVGNQPAADKATLNREFIKEPLEYSMAIAQRAATEAVSRAMGPSFDTQVENAKSLARGSGENATIFDKYEQEIVANVNNVEPALRMNVNVWRNALAIVKGNHIDEILAARGQQQQQQDDTHQAPGVIIRRADGPAPAGDKAPPAPAAAKLTDQERQVARRFGITDEQYALGKKQNLEQSDEILDPIGKSSWDPYITFSSREKRRAERARRAATANNTK